MKKISVAMTTYNGETFLAEQLDSILAQSRLVDELVVCDDGSTDGTVGILNDFSKRAPFFVNIVVNEKNLGSTKNFEKAMSLCTGDIIILCDQDDVWLQDKVKILENVFLKNRDCTMAFTDAMVVDEACNVIGKLWPNYGFDRKKQNILHSENGLKLFVNANVVTGATAAVTKMFFEKAKPFPKEFIHDHWLAAVAAQKNSLFFSNAVTIKYRRHLTQQLGTPNKESIAQKATRVCDYDKEIKLMQIMFDELDKRFRLTKKQQKIFIGRINFCRRRNNLPNNIFARAVKITADLFCGNYHKYSSGVLSAAKDLVFKNVKGQIK